MPPAAKRRLRRSDAAAQRRAVGQRAEAIVARHLEHQGFVIIGRNVPVARGELDIIARRGRLLVFCEVRARQTDTHVSPADTIDAAKIRRVRAAARAWLSRSGEAAAEIRLDAAAVVFDTPEGRLTYYEGAF